MRTLPFLADGFSQKVAEIANIMHCGKNSFAYLVAFCSKDHPMEARNVIDDAFRYGHAEHAQYEKEGYFIFQNFLTPEALAECSREIDGMLERLQPGRATDEIIGAHEQEPWIWNLATQPEVLDLIERQVGGDILFWSSHLICKAPHSGRGIPWHQDAPYWNVTAKLPCGVWIGFDDMDADNGAMCVLPGYQNDTLPIRQSGDNLFDEEIDPSGLPEDFESSAVQYRFPAGGMAIHHTMIPHRSFPNQSSRWRRVLVLRFMAAGGTLGAKQYEDYRNGEPFDRKYYVVRGSDQVNAGLPSRPDWPTAG